jgi:hypothetical protein
MFVDIQNNEFLPDLGTETNLTEAAFDQTSLLDAQTNLTGPLVHDNTSLVPRVGDSVTDDSTEDKAKL